MPNGRNLPVPHAPGPPHALTDETIAALIAATRNGCPRHVTAQVCKVGLSTFNRYLAIGGSEPPQRDDYISDAAHRKAWEHWERCSSLREGIEEAQGLHHQDMLVCIGNAVRQGDASTALRFLQAKYPHLYSVHRIEVTGEGGGPIRIESATIEQMLADPKRAEDMADASVDEELRNSSLSGEPGSNGGAPQPG